MSQYAAITLNPDQDTALAEILAARSPGDAHLLTGYAGTGKTSLVQHFARVMAQKGIEIVLTAPTHKAVAVLARKLREAGTIVPCLTIHSLLQLTPKPHGDRMIFERKKHAKPITADIVVIDECSMVSADLIRHIRRHLPVSFVLYVGDPAQIPPVGERESETFATRSRSHLGTIVRQAAENPILQAAHTIRASQGGPLDWSWCRSAKAPPLGVFLPKSVDSWMRKGFLSARFTDDPDNFRYLCWTNEQVAHVNRKVRHWIYDGETPTPFMPGERALARSPVFMADGKTLLISTNEETTVRSIRAATFSHTMRSHDSLDGWIAEIPSWRVTLLKDDGGGEVEIDTPRDVRTYQKVLARIADEAADHRERWGDHHSLKQRIGQLQPIYAMTVHTSQGSTFRNVFVDLPDIRRRCSNVLETQQLLYVAATRPSHALVLVGAI